MGYSLARHRLHVSGTVSALALLPNPSPHSRQDAEGHVNLVHNLTVVVVVLLAAFMALIVRVVQPTDELMTALIRTKLFMLGGNNERMF